MGWLRYSSKTGSEKSFHGPVRLLVARMSLLRTPAILTDAYGIELGRVIRCDGRRCIEVCCSGWRMLVGRKPWHAAD